MNLTVPTLIFILAASTAAGARDASLSGRKASDSSASKRALVEGNAGVEKRAPLLPTINPSVTPGIQYADSKDQEVDKSPSQQIYASPVPQISKISDLLSGQGPFQAAIASQLYAPVSVYQARLPTAYAVSQPIPSQLAYSEKQSYRVNPQYTPQIYSQKPQTFDNPQVQNQPQFYQSPLTNPQQIYQQIPIYQPQIPQYQIPQELAQGIQVYQQSQLFSLPPQSLNQVQPSQPLAQAPQAPGILYAKETTEDNRQQIQRELKPEPTEQTRVLEQKGLPQQNQNYNNQGAVSYASFSQSQPTPYQQVQQPKQYQPQQPQRQVQPQPQQQYLQLQLPQPQYHLNQYQVQPLYQQQQQLQAVQHQYQTQPQFQNKIEPPQANAIPSQVKPTANPVFLRPALQQQFFQPQYTSGPASAQGYQPQVLAVSPTFPPVQFFGKFAPSIFAHYQQQ